MRRVLAIAAVAGVMGCEDPGGFGILTGDGSFEPAVLDYGAIPLGQTAPMPAVLRNQTGTDAPVTSIRFDPETDAFAAKTADGGALRGVFVRQNGRVELQVLFAPRAALDYSTTMILALGTTEVALPIKAFGREPAPPKVVLSPSTVVLAPTAVGADAVARVSLTNAGESSSRLRTIRQTSGDSASFRVLAPGGGQAVPSQPISGEEQETLPLEVHFTPTEARTYQATFELSFDTGEPATLSVAGTGAPAGDLTCDAPSLDFGPVARGDTASLPVHCTVSGGVWELARVGLTPATASSFHLPTPPMAVSANGTLDFDVVFVAEGLPAALTGSVEIVSRAGASTRVALAGEVIPPASSSQALSVSLRWDTQHTDLDLHLTRSGAALFDTGDDCYFAMKNPDWGTLGRSEDDPFLDRDATDGLGPEEVNLTAPGEDVYDVWVHYYNYSTSSSLPTRATVQWALQGAAGATESILLLSACGSAWHVGRVDFGAVPPRFEVDALVTDDYRPFSSPRCQ